MYKAKLINLLTDNPDAEIQVEQQKFTDNAMSPDEVARAAGREMRVIYSTVETRDSDLELYERWIVFPAKGTK